MNHDMNQLETWATGLLSQLAPKARRQLARTIATALRRSQQQRIAAQQSPDGETFTPRKAQYRTRIGRVKHRAALFPKIRQNKYLQIHSNPDSAAITFTRQVQRLAQVHHYGLRDKVNRYGLIVRYPNRPLLGFSKTDEALVSELVLAHLARR